MTDDSERLMPRYYDDTNTLTMAERAARHIAEKQDYEWDNLDESWQQDRIRQALSFLEAAGVERLRAQVEEQRGLLRLIAEAVGAPEHPEASELVPRVERLRAELESCRSVNAALTSKLEGEKWVNELLRKRLTTLGNTIDHLSKSLDEAEKDRDSWREKFSLEEAAHLATMKDRDEQKELREDAEAELDRLRDHIKTLREAQTRNVNELKARADRAEASDRGARAAIQNLLDRTGLDSLEHVAEDFSLERMRGARTRIAALEKVVEAADRMRQFASQQWLDKGPVLRPQCMQVYDDAKRALDSAQPAPEYPAPEAVASAAGVTLNNGARDERIRAFQAAARTVPEDTVRLSERLDAANERIRELEAERDNFERAASYDAVRSKVLVKRIRELEAELAKRSDKSAEHVELLSIGVNHNADRVMKLEKRIRVACAELLRLSHSELGASRADLDRIARELEGKDSGQPGETRDATGTVRAGSDSESRAGVFQESPSDPDAAEHRTWILEQHARMESRADIRTLCIIAAQFETTQPQMQPLAEKLNGPERNAGPEYAIRLVERMRGRLEETR